MAADFNRDREMDGLLKRSLRAEDPAGPCVDAEQLAAWAEGGLNSDDAAAVEAHLATCARCREMAAAFSATETEPVVAAAAADNVVSIGSGKSIRWVLPLVGTLAATLVIWIAVRDRTPEPEITLSQVQGRGTASETGASAAGGVATPLESRSAFEKSKPRAEARGAGSGSQADRSSKVAGQAAPVARPADAAPAAPPVATTATPAGRTTRNELKFLPGVATPPAPAKPTAPPPAAPPPPAPTFRSGVTPPTQGAAASPTPSPTPAAATPTLRNTAVNGLQPMINITIDGVSNAALARSTDAFFANGGITEFSSSARLDAVEETRLADRLVGAVGGGAGRGGGGGGGRAGGAGGRGGAAAAAAMPEGRGAIEGVVRDATGSAVPGVTVTAKPATATTTGTADAPVAVTDATGTYRFTSLAPGTYRVAANLTGFLTQTFDSVAVDAGRLQRLNVTLAVGALNESVRVVTATTTWRIFRNNVVYRSRDDRATWTPVTLESGLPAIVAGAAPSTEVCWLVGRAGIVLVSKDATTFTRVATPSNVDLVSVRATNALVATVVAADGRMFTTADGGLTWK